VTVEYCYGVPKRVHTVILSAQHAPEVHSDVLARDLTEMVIREVVPAELRDERTRILINPSGRFAIGGPMADTGLTGRKILVDTYGGLARHGGGAFSGKDPTKVDRSGAYAARYVAKNLVAAGLADRMEVLVSYAIGVATPTSVSLEAFGTGKVDDQVIHDLAISHFDLRPAAIIEDLNLRRPIYKAVAAYGHFGRDDLDLPWERTDKAAELRAAAGLK
jgi:S-adenosylmethionine synthetase